MASNESEQRIEQITRNNESAPPNANSSKIIANNTLTSKSSKAGKKSTVVRSHPKRIVDNLALLESTINEEDRARLHFNRSKYEMIKPRNPILGQITNRKGTEEYYLEKIHKNDNGQVSAEVDNNLSNRNVYTTQDYREDLRILDELHIQKLSIQKELRHLETVLGIHASTRELCLRQAPHADEIPNPPRNARNTLFLASQGFNTCMSDEALSKILPPKPSPSFL